MGAAVAVVADVVYSAVVSKLASKVVSEVAEALGASEKTANLLGGIAGIAVGTHEFTEGRASGFLREKGGFESVVNPFIKAPDVTSTEKGGLLDYGTDIDPTTGKAIEGAATETAGKATSEIAGETVKGATDAAAKEPWYKTMWGSEKVGEIGAGFVSGAAQGYMGAAAAEDAAKAEQEREDEYNKKWQEFDPTSVAQLQYPSIAKTSSPPGMLSYPIPASPYPEKR